MDQIFNESELRNHNITAFKIVKNHDDIKANKFMLGTALKYIMIGQNGKVGQGDIDEGLIARYRIGNKKSQRRIEEFKYCLGSDIIIRKRKDFVDVFRKSTLLTALGCFYSLNANVMDYLSDSDLESKKGTLIEVEICTEINNKLFRDFANNGNEKFKDIKIFYYDNVINIYKCVEEGLKKYGIQNFKRTEIFMETVIYDKIRDCEWECPEYSLNKEKFLSYPVELFYKDVSFSYQKEKRIIVPGNRLQLSSQFLMDKDLFKICPYDRLGLLIDIKKQKIFETKTPELELMGAPVNLKIKIPIQRVIR